MRISMVSEHASPLAALGGVDAGGQNVHVAALSRALVQRGHEVTVFTRRDSADLPAVVHTDDGVDVVHVTAGPAETVGKDDLLPFMPTLGAGIAEYWEHHPEHTPDVVHSHFWMSGLAAAIALETADLTHVPLAHTFHALGTVKRRHQGARDTSPAERADLEPFVGRRCARVIATCHDEVAELARMGIPALDTSVVPCGVDLEQFTPGHGLPNGGAEDTGGARRIVSIGRLVPRKGMDLPIRALALLRERGYEDVELHIVGGGGSAEALRDDPEASRLRDLAAELGVSDAVHLRGQVPRETVPALLRSARLVACTPWYEPFGIVPLEAMGCGVPVVAAEVGGLADTVVDRVTGLHVPPRDAISLAGAFAQLLDDAEFAAELGRAGRARAEDRYAWPVVAEATERVYTELLASPAAAIRERVVPTPALPDPPEADVLVLPRAHCDASAEIEAHFAGFAEALASLRAQREVLDSWAASLLDAFTTGHRVLIAGNGGSAAEAQHLSAELVGRFAHERCAFPAIALTTDTSTLTAVSNDYGFDHVFARQVEAFGSPGDVLVLLSTSGRSVNLLRAAETARRLGVRTWALTGPAPNPLAELSDEALCIDAAAPHVQETHLMAVHILCRAFDLRLADRTERNAQIIAARSDEWDRARTPMAGAARPPMPAATAQAARATRTARFAGSGVVAR